MARARQGSEKRVPRVEQWIEIRVRNGKVTTELYPSNTELQKRAESMKPPAKQVYRRLNFPDGVPAEYGWATDDPVTAQYGGCAIQRMSYEGWLAVIAREGGFMTGHVGSIGDWTLPRPEAEGGCDCPTCVDAREREERTKG